MKQITKRKKQNQKKKNLFQHLNQVTAIQNPDYWDTLTEDDIKTWSNYMIHRFLSMKMEWIDLVNEFQKYNLESKDLYNLYINVLPKGKQFLKYTKRRNQMEHPEWLINIIRNQEEYSRKEAVDMIEILYLTEGGMLELREICVKWGIEENKIEELGINVLGSIGHGDY